MDKFIQITKGRTLYAVRFIVHVGDLSFNGPTNKQTKKQTNSVALNPQANYTNCATATCRRNLVPTFVDRGVSRGQRSGSAITA
jgi:hypothetical protein